MKRFAYLLCAGVLSITLVQLSAAAAPAQHLSDTDAREIATSYDYLTDNFYKKVDPQAVLDSVRTQLLGAMRTAGVKHAELAPMPANAAQAVDVREIDREVEQAASGIPEVHRCTT